MAVNTEKIYHCEVRRLFKKSKFTKEWRWMPKAVSEAVSSADAKFRCKDCHGALKLPLNHLADATTPHVVHKSRVDSEYCPAGVHFQLSKDGREPRLSLKPLM
ncbi:MAG: hypothetical protein JWO13_42 [Acidobacteriales bacterium]|nr:hypothetical protein [Terriglobales bacterium]